MLRTRRFTANARLRVEVFLLVQLPVERSQIDTEICWNGFGWFCAVYGSGQFPPRLWHSGVWSLHCWLRLVSRWYVRQTLCQQSLFFASQVTRESSRQAQLGRVTTEGSVGKFVVVYSGVASEDQILLLL